MNKYESLFLNSNKAYLQNMSSINYFDENIEKINEEFKNGNFYWTFLINAFNYYYCKQNNENLSKKINYDKIEKILSTYNFDLNQVDKGGNHLLNLLSNHIGSNSFLNSSISFDLNFDDFLNLYNKTTDKFKLNIYNEHFLFNLVSCTINIDLENLYNINLEKFNNKNDNNKNNDNIVIKKFFIDFFNDEKNKDIINTLSSNNNLYFFDKCVKSNLLFVSTELLKVNALSNNKFSIFAYKDNNFIKSFDYIIDQKLSKNLFWENNSLLKEDYYCFYLIKKVLNTINESNSLITENIIPLIKEELMIIDESNLFKNFLPDEKRILTTLTKEKLSLITAIEEKMILSKNLDENNHLNDKKKEIFKL